IIYMFSFLSLFVFSLYMLFICWNILHYLSYCQSTWLIQDVKFFFKFHILSGFSLSLFSIPFSFFIMPFSFFFSQCWIVWNEMSYSSASFTFVFLPFFF